MLVAFEYWHAYVSESGLRISICLTVRERVQSLSQLTPLITKALSAQKWFCRRYVWLWKSRKRWCQGPSSPQTSIHRSSWPSKLRSAARWVCWWNFRSVVVICACPLCADHTDCACRNPQEYTLTLLLCQPHLQALSSSGSAGDTVFQSKIVSYLATARLSN